MKPYSLLLILSVGLSLVSFSGAARQSGKLSFSKDGLALEYPATWSLTDQSDLQAQQLILTRKDTTEMIVVFVLRETLAPGSLFQKHLRNVTESYIDNLAKKFESPQRAFQCTEVGKATVAGAVVRGEYHSQPTTFEVYAFVKGGRFAQLVYLRSDKDAANADPVWELVRSTLTINDAIKAYADPVVDIISGGSLNGKARKLPQPAYPLIAKGAHVSGPVVVQVLIDEEGNVAWAQAMSGHPLLQAAAIQAAKAAKFTPTSVCGKRVRVYGRVVYNFVAM